MLSEPQQGSLARQGKEDVTVPLGILLVVRLIPPQLLAEHRAAAAARQAARPVSVAAAAVMVALWLAPWLLP